MLCIGLRRWIDICCATYGTFYIANYSDRNEWGAVGVRRFRRSRHVQA